MHWRTHLYLHQPCHCTFMAYLGVACCRYCLNPVLFADNCSWVRQIPSIYVCMYIYIGILYRWSQFGKPVCCSLILHLSWLSNCIFPSALQRICPREACMAQYTDEQGQDRWKDVMQWEAAQFLSHTTVTKSFFPSAKHFPLSHPFFPTCVFCSSLLTWLAKSHSVSADWSGSTWNI